MLEIKYPKEKIILTDVDGCLVDWNLAFHKWMTLRNYNKVNHSLLIEDQYELTKVEIRKLISTFNESSHISNLEPIDGAQYYVEKLYDLGYRFICITSIGLTDNIRDNRISNLKNLFNKDAFLQFEFLKTYRSKEEILMQYRDIGKYWIEDNYTQYTIGCNLGLESYYLTDEHNPNYVNSWKQIYNRIVETTSI